MTHLLPNVKRVRRLRNPDAQRHVFIYDSEAAPASISFPLRPEPCCTLAKPARTSVSRSFYRSERWSCTLPPRCPRCGSCSGTFRSTGDVWIRAGTSRTSRCTGSDWWHCSCRPSTGRTRETRDLRNAGWRMSCKRQMLGREARAERMRTRPSLTFSSPADKIDNNN